MAGRLLSLNRRQFLAAGVVASLGKASGATLTQARSAIGAGELGEVRFCRIFSGSAHRIDKHLRAVEFAMGCGGALSISTQQNGGSLYMATIRYPRCIVSYESRDGIKDVITFHGDRATLRVSP